MRETIHCWLTLIAKLTDSLISNRATDYNCIAGAEIYHEYTRRWMITVIIADPEKGYTLATLASSLYLCRSCAGPSNRSRCDSFICSCSTCFLTILILLASNVKYIVHIIQQRFSIVFARKESKLTRIKLTNTSVEDSKCLDENQQNVIIVSLFLMTLTLVFMFYSEPLAT